MHPCVSWQDLKDWAREAGDVTFSNVFDREGDHMGLVEFKDQYGLDKALSGFLEDLPLQGQRVKIERESPDAEYSKISVNRGNDNRPRDGTYAPRYDNGSGGGSGGGARDAYYSNDRPRSGGYNGNNNAASPPAAHRDAGRYDSRCGSGGADHYRSGSYDHQPPSSRDDAPPPSTRYDNNRGPPPPPVAATGGGDRDRDRDRDRGYDNRRAYR